MTATRPTPLPLRHFGHVESYQHGGGANGVASGLRALDLFAGAGGLSCGFEWLGGQVVGAVEIDTNASRTFAHNHPAARVWTEDIRKLDPRRIGDELGDLDIVIGGPMCQGVSQRGPRDPSDERNFALTAFADYVRVLQPRYFVMENVPALVSDVHNRALAIRTFERLESLGYELSAEVLAAAWFGVPQLRYRTVVIGRRNGTPGFPAVAEAGALGLLADEHYTTVGEAIGDLPVIGAGGGSDVSLMPGPSGDLSAYAKLVRGNATELYNHWSADTDDINLRRIAHVPEGGYWQNIPLDLLPDRFRSVRPSDHTTTYRRLDRAHPAFTVTTECGNVTSGAFTHPQQNRAISVREAARLQGFPDDFRFLGPKNSQYRQIGNAVPPLLARAVLQGLLDGTGGYRGRVTASVLRAHPDSRLPFTLAPRYKSLFGKSTWALRRKDTLAREALAPASVPLDLTVSA